MATRQRLSSTTMVIEKPQPSNEPVYPDIQTIRDAIPAHCFESSLATSSWFVFRDLTIVSCLVWAAITFIPTIQDPVLRFSAWMVYGFAQGLIGTGIWILAHECGHGAFSKYSRLNDFVGWALHSLLMVPYFSWKFSHHRHHRFTGHMDKDMAFVPSTEPKSNKKSSDKPSSGGLSLHDLMEDAPIAQLFVLLAHQLFGWQAYLFFGVTTGKGGMQRPVKGRWFGGVSHFLPTSAVFRPNEAVFVAISDLGLAITLFALYKATQVLDLSTVLLLYLVPYAWVHHWIVAITYLQHNHADVPHYNEEGWTFVKGALATIDREFGFIGKHLFHGIIEKHVIHHLFPRIPFYKAGEATEAIKPLLGDLYHHDDRNFLGQLWSTFGSLNYVETDPNRRGQMRWAK